MKTYLTKTGLLVVRDDASFFTSNNGEFRRLATDDEVDYLTKEVAIPEIGWKDRTIQAAREGAEFFGTTLDAMLVSMEIPLWYYLWSVSIDDYSTYKPGSCNNGGDYSFHEKHHFFARSIECKWEIKALKTYSTSAEFSYDELTGDFQQNLNTLTAIGIAPYELEDEHGEYLQKNEFYFETQTASREDEEIALDLLLEEGQVSVSQAVLCHNIKIVDTEDTECDYPSDDEIRRRYACLDKIGYKE